MNIELPIPLDSNTDKLCLEISKFLATRGVSDIWCLPTAIKIISSVHAYIDSEDNDWSKVEGKLESKPCFVCGTYKKS